MSAAPESSRRRRVVAAPVAAVLLAAWAAPAQAADPTSRYGDALSVPEAVLLFVGAPLALLALIALLVALPGILRRPRYRPAKGWSGGAVWFGGPDGTPAEIEDTVREAEPSSALGGARGDW